MLQASVKSSLIECKYHFRVSTEFDSILCCSGKPNIEIPIIMYIPDIRPNVQIYQPNNWNPTTMPLCEINLPTYNEVVGSNNQHEISLGGIGMVPQSQAFPVNQGGMTMTTQTQAVKIESGIGNYKN